MPLLSRRWLRENRRALNKHDAEMLQKLFKGARCMHRIVGPDGLTYSYCGNAATHDVAGGRILLCNTHREQ